MPATMPDFEKCVALLRCGPEQASAFFVTPTLAVATRHSVLPFLLAGEAIRLRFLDEAESWPVVLASPDVPVTEDIVFLASTVPVSSSRLLLLRVSHLPRGLRWESFGYPGTRGTNGAHIRGAVARALLQSTSTSDAELSCDDFRALSDYEGCSGAPVVVEGRVQAILQRQLDGVLGAISLLRLQKYLDSAAVPYESVKGFADTDALFHADLKNARPNLRTFWELEEAAQSGTRGYVALSGSPGSGKTLISAGFQPSAPQNIVVGRYFVDTTAYGSNLPAEHYRQASTFAVWLAGEAALATREAVGVTREQPLPELMTSIVHNLAALGAYCLGKSQRGILLVDLADPWPSTSEATGFLRLLPESPPDGLCVVLVTSNPNLLQQSYPDLCIGSAVAVSRLPPGDCESLVLGSLGSAVPMSRVLEIAHASEGNPLILTLLIREEKAALAAGTQGEPLEGVTFPSIDAYYERTWKRRSGKSATVWLLGLVARLRHGVVADQLVGMLPPTMQADFPASYAAARHLLRDDYDWVRVYHSSFRAFAVAKTAMLDTVIHDHLATYCLGASATFYGCANLVYHHLSGSKPSQQKARSLCTQNWIDSAAVLCVPPEFLLEDVQQVLGDSLADGSLPDAVRLLLLQSRTRFRYDKTLFIFAFEIALVVLALHGAHASLPYVVRDGQLLCSDEQAVHLIRLLRLDGEDAAAAELYAALKRRCVAQYDQREGRIGTIGAHIESCALVAGISGESGVHEFEHLLRFVSQVVPDRNAEATLCRTMLRGSPFGSFLWHIGHFPRPKQQSRKSTPQAQAIELAWIVLKADELRSQLGPGGKGASQPKQLDDGLVLMDRASAIAEIERLTREHGVLPGAERPIATCLLNGSRASDLLKHIAEHIFSEPTRVSIRMPNGVDPNLRVVADYYFAAEISGFTGQNLLDTHFVVVTREPWEERFLKALVWLGQRAGRLRRDNGTQMGAESLLNEVLGALLPLIRFTLAERARWKDSYALPEAMLPEILGRTAEVIGQWEPSSLPAFYEALAPGFADQLGVYTEGFRRALGGLAASCRSVPEGATVSASCYRALVLHVRTCVAHRIERVGALLAAARGAAEVGDHQLASEAFREAIGSSLGPDWYKEAQFGLFMDVLDSAADREVTRTHWRGVAEALELASGEVTFQRYVRHEKVRLIEHLATHGFIGEAARLFLHYILPSLAIQEARILRVPVDTFEKYRGSRYGVLEVPEEEGALSILAGCKEALVPIRYALWELFAPGDKRYIDEFAQELCGLLSTGERTVVQQRVLRCLRADFVADRRQELADAVQRKDTSGVASALVTKGVALGLFSQTAPGANATGRVPRGSENTAKTGQAGGTQEVPTDEESVPGTFGRKAGLRALESSVNRATTQLATGDGAGARASLANGLEEAQTAGWGIWEGSGAGETALELLFAKCGSAAECLASLRTAILEEEHADEWIIARSLIVYGVISLSPEAKADLIAVVIDHIRSILRPEAALIRGTAAADFDEILSTPVAHTPDAAVEEILVALLDHPNPFMRTRVGNAILWLWDMPYGFRLERLANRALGNPLGYGREMSAGLLHTLALKNGARVCREIPPQALKSMCHMQNGIVRYAAREIVRLGEAAGVAGIAAIIDEPDAEAGDQGSDTPVASSGIADTGWSWRPDSLRVLEALGRPATGDAAWTALKEICGDRSPSALAVLWDVRNSAFDTGNQFWSASWEREAIFRIAGERGSGKELEQVAPHAMWNPEWPESELRVDWDLVCPRILDGLAKGTFRPGDLMLRGKTILHCLEIVAGKKEEDRTDYELVACLVPSGPLKGPLDWERLVEAGSLHRHVQSQPPGAVRRTQTTEAAIVKYPTRPMIGGEVTPSRPAQRLIGVAPGRSFERVLSLDGRQWVPWGIGPPVTRACALLMDGGWDLRPSGYDLVWCFIVNGTFQYIIHPAQRQLLFIGGER